MIDGKQLCEVYLNEMKAESGATRKCLERIPESLYKYKPHETSMEMGYLALLVADIPNWIKCIVEDSLVDFETYQHFQLSTTDKMLAYYDKCIEGASNALKNISAESLKTDFELRRGKQVLWKIGKVEAIANTINHWVHHRGQLTVYMRMNELTIPALYGPSGDEKNF
jgi:uncharacterized damage-inducible protein DinB